LSTITYSVPDISCDHCRTAITSEVSTLAGVESVEVDIDAKTVTVTAEPLDEAAIVAAIDEAGYEVAA
jgi:copper chaperone